MAGTSDFARMNEIKRFFTNYLPNINLNSVNSTKVLPSHSHSVGITKNELLIKLLASCAGLAVSMGITFVGLKWLLNALDPTKQEKKEAHLRAERLMKKIGVEGVALTDYELCIASNLVDPLSMVTSWTDIGGLDDCIQEIQESVIMPFRNQQLFTQSSLLQPPKGVLLYGPPGCGKTMIAKATAKAAGARFINLQVSSLVDKWYGESQKRAEAVFSLALKLQPVIIFIDEIDSFLRSRTSSDHEVTAMIKTQFMSFWDGLMTGSNTRIIIMGATNRPRDVDAAILRRMPAMFRVGLPKKAQRQSILELVLRQENLSPDVDLSVIADHTENFSGSDLKELCRNAALYCVRDYLQVEKRREEEQGEGDAFSLAPEDQEDMQELPAISGSNFRRALSKMKQNKSSSFGAVVDDVIECD